MLIHLLWASIATVLSGAVGLFITRVFAIQFDLGKEAKKESADCSGMIAALVTAIGSFGYLLVNESYATHFTFSLHLALAMGAIPPSCFLAWQLLKIGYRKVCQLADSLFSAKPEE